MSRIEALIKRGLQVVQWLGGMRMGEGWKENIRRRGVVYSIKVKKNSISIIPWLGSIEQSTIQPQVSSIQLLLSMPTLCKSLSVLQCYEIWFWLSINLKNDYFSHCFCFWSYFLLLIVVKFYFHYIFHFWPFEPSGINFLFRQITVGWEKVSKQNSNSFRLLISLDTMILGNQV